MSKSHDRKRGTRLTIEENRLFGELKRRGEMTPDEMVNFMYSHRADGGPLWARKCVSLYLSHIRQKTGLKLPCHTVYRFE